MDLLARDPPLPKTLLLMCCGVLWCGVVWCGVVWCVGVVCVHDFRGCVQDFGAPPNSPYAGPLPPTLPPPQPPPPDRPKFRSFFSLSRHNFRSFFCLSLGVSWKFWWCLKRRDPQMCTFGLTGCRVKPRRLLAKCQEQFYIFFALPLLLRLPKKSMTNYYKFCLYPEKKLRTHRNSTGRRLSPLSGPTPLGPLFFWVVVCAVCAATDSAACCCFSCCLCSCCGLLPLLLLLLVLVSAVCTIAAAFFCCCCFCLLLLLGRRPSNPLLHLAVFDFPKCP